MTLKYFHRKALFEDIEQCAFVKMETKSTLDLQSGIIPGFTNLTQEDALCSTIGLINDMYLKRITLTIREFLSIKGDIRIAISIAYTKVIEKREAANVPFNTREDAMIVALKRIREDIINNKSDQSILTIAIKRFEKANFVDVLNVDEDAVQSVDKMNVKKTRSWDEVKAFTERSDCEFTPITRLVLSRLKSVTLDAFNDDNSTNKTLEFYESTGLPKYVDYYSYKNKLQELFDNMSSSSDMLNRIKEMSKFIPPFCELYDVLTSDKKDKNGVVVSDIYLNTFFSDFNKVNIIKKALLFTPDIKTSKMELVVPNKANHYILSDKWINDVKSNLYSKKTETLFGKFQKASRNPKDNRPNNIDPSKDLSIPGSALSIKIYRILKGNRKFDYRAAIEELSKFGKMLGINISANDIALLVKYQAQFLTVDQKANPKTVTNNKTNTLFRVFSSFDNVRKDVIGLDTGKPIFDSYGRLNWIAEIVYKYTLNVNNNS